MSTVALLSSWACNWIKKLGANPYKFGMTASSDTHTALATTREDNYFGNYRATEPSADRHNNPVVPSDDPDLQILTSQESASGLTAVRESCPGLPGRRPYGGRSLDCPQGQNTPFDGSRLA